MSHLFQFLLICLIYFWLSLFLLLFLSACIFSSLFLISIFSSNRGFIPGCLYFFTYSWLRIFLPLFLVTSLYSVSLNYCYRCFSSCFFYFAYFWLTLSLVRLLVCLDCLYFFYVWVISISSYMLNLFPIVFIPSTIPECLYFFFFLC